ncbi:6-hydroxymethylpterin diphosphokinase MptE-like protein [Gayadomonas joobiniege]|uniref:6-hydroxymethylpterin diphosphokinase MptE-like protein n=1 Tax=Gayadomonas joobiniege TaxID=1234606 RepID=UPI00036AC439|nr:6-hydroxymethylpterin diphosphokinase MptE-like protein [Gayadomonas joobiniege]
MLNNIQLHISDDEALQSELELESAQLITKIERQNIRAFSKYMPSVLNYLKTGEQGEFGVFLNKWREFNLVDMLTGRTFYGLHPRAEVEKQVDVYFKKPISLKVRHTYGQNSEQVLVVLGLGLGLHLDALLAKADIRHLVIYEPNIDLFKNSVLVTQWFEILEELKKREVVLYLQLGSDGRDIQNNLQELIDFAPSISQIYFYRHYNHPIFNSVFKHVKQSGDWQSFIEQAIQFKAWKAQSDYLPSWTTAVDRHEFKQLDVSKHALFERNLAALKYFFPEIYQQFKDYKPKHWRILESSNGEVNLHKTEEDVYWMGAEPKQEGRLSYEGFARHPNKDGLILGYQGTKLKNYYHQRYVKSVSHILSALEEKKGRLPESLKSTIFFGIGCGYSLAEFSQNHQVENLFICEPEPDFFYASLFAIDWDGILKRADESRGRVYINVGDDGTSLFRDLLRQFYAIGPYNLAQTYFYQGYYNELLNAAVSQLREQLQTVIAMGEYYDHAKYGIAHTTHSIKSHHKFLIKKPAEQLSLEDREIPFFVVGNGPSLDASIEALKEHQHQAIIISCGTALQALHRYGIKPDFHAEVEQNRATFDWCSRINDFDYLKGISLISCNGIHPDTASLFKEVYLTFKEGESSTTSALHILGESQYEVLKFAFPTVANLVMNVVLSFCPHEVYLIGVDLGFVNNKKHHSINSGYFKSGGKELYDYNKKLNTNIPTKGNFRNTVFTKHEFKISRTLLENAIATSRNTQVYNCSDGAFIKGSTPLKADNILILGSQARKRKALSNIKKLCYTCIDAENYINLFHKKYQDSALFKDLDKLIQLNKNNCSTLQEAETLLEKQRILLFESYQSGHSLLFYLLYGTLNYSNASMSKALTSDAGLTAFLQIKEQWMHLLETIKRDYQAFPMLPDFCSAFDFEREKIYLQQLTESKKVVFCTAQDLEFFSGTENLDDVVDFSILSHAKNNNQLDGQVCIGDYINYELEKLMNIYLPDSYDIDHLYHQQCRDYDAFIGFFDNLQCSYICDCLSKQLSEHTRLNGRILINLTYLPTPRDLAKLKTLSPKVIVCFTPKPLSKENIKKVISGTEPWRMPRTEVLLTSFVLDERSAELIIPRFMFVNENELIHHPYTEELAKKLADYPVHIEFSEYILIPERGSDLAALSIDKIGARGRPCYTPITEQVLLKFNISPSDAMKKLNLLKTNLNYNLISEISDGGGNDTH